MNIFRYLRPAIFSSIRMKPGDMFEAAGELCVVIDVGHNEGDDVTGVMWRHKTRPATDEERIAYEVMRT